MYVFLCLLFCNCNKHGNNKKEKKKKEKKFFLACGEIVPMNTCVVTGHGYDPGVIFNCLPSF